MKKLVESLIQAGVLKTQRLIDAFLACDRKQFVPKEFAEAAYLDMPLHIGFGQTISQPYTVAFMMELLAPAEGQKILDVGFGSGWTTAILANAVGAKGRVYGLEIIPELFGFGKGNLQKFGYENIELQAASGWEGWPAVAPFDRILVSAAAPKVPEALKEQLSIGGRMVIPVGDHAVADLESWYTNRWYSQSIKLIQKLARDKFEEKDHPGFAFVPLVR